VSTDWDICILLGTYTQGLGLGQIIYRTAQTTADGKAKEKYWRYNCTPLHLGTRWWYGHFYAPADLPTGKVPPLPTEKEDG
jgi:hypothetical protein